MSINTVEYANQLLAENADLKKQYAERDAMQLDEAGNYYCRHVSAMTAEDLHSKGDIAAELGWRDMQIDQLNKKIEELTADLDKESEIRHRIHEELNAIKGEQQAVAWAKMPWNGASNWSSCDPEYVANPEGWHSDYKPLYTHPAPAVLPPEYEAQTISPHELEFTEGYNQCRTDALALGAKPLPVIELAPDRKVDLAVSPYDGEAFYVSGWNDRGKADGKKIREAGLEVKS